MTQDNIIVVFYIICHCYQVIILKNQLLTCSQVLYVEYVFINIVNIILNLMNL